KRATNIIISPTRLPESIITASSGLHAFKNFFQRVLDNLPEILKLLAAFLSLKKVPAAVVQVRVNNAESPRVSGVPPISRSTTESTIEEIRQDIPKALKSQLRKRGYDILCPIG